MFLWTLTQWKNPPPSGCPGAKHLIQFIRSECRAATFLWLQLTYCCWNDKLRCVSSRKPKCLPWCLSFREKHLNRRIINLNLGEDSRQMSRWRKINSGSLFVCQFYLRCFYVLCGCYQLQDTTFTLHTQGQLWQEAPSLRREGGKWKRRLSRFNLAASFQSVTQRLNFSLLHTCDMTMALCETMTRQILGFGTRQPAS